MWSRYIYILSLPTLVDQKKRWTQRHDSKKYLGLFWYIPCTWKSHGGVAALTMSTLASNRQKSKPNMKRQHLVAVLIHFYSMVRTNDDTFCLLDERWAGQPGHQDPAEQASHPHHPAQVRHDHRYAGHQDPAEQASHPHHPAQVRHDRAG